VFRACAGIDGVEAGTDAADDSQARQLREDALCDRRVLDEKRVEIPARGEHLVFVCAIGDDEFDASIAEQFDEARYPFNIPALKSGIDLAFRTNVTLFVGENGSGKSTLLAAISSGAHRRVDAAAFPTTADSPDAVADCLAGQLARVLHSFPDAVTSLSDLIQALRAVTGRRVRIALDAAPATEAIVECVLADRALRRVQLVTVDSGPPSIRLDGAERYELYRYCRHRGVPDADIERIVDLAMGDWSVARALADLAVGT